MVAAVQVEVISSKVWGEPKREIFQTSLMVIGPPIIKEVENDPIVEETSLGTHSPLP